MAIEIFRHKEKEYFKWIEIHKNGLVVNTQDGNCSYFTLHKASCRSVSNSNNPWGAFTERDYYKVCSDNIYELKNWFLDNKPKFQEKFDICKICNPDDTAIIHPPLCLFPDTIEPNKKTYTEGAKKEIKVNAYERNNDARIKCLKYHGYKCTVCETQFSDVYGEIGKNFIHVHHLREISEIGSEYEFDPIKDLKPVCPNCHAMLHQRKPCFTIEEMKTIYQQNCN